MKINIILNGESSRYTLDSETLEVCGIRGPVKPTSWGSKGYLMYSFNHRGRKVRILEHRLLAEYLLGGIPHLHTVNHKDGDKTNNTLGNLEIVSLEDNILHAFETGLSKGRAYRKVRVERGGEVQFYPSINQAKKATGVNPGNISEVLSKGGGVLKGFHFSEIE